MKPIYFPISCKNCEAFFKPTCKENIYCSKECYRSGQSVILTCTICSTVFKRSLSQSLKSSSCFCSNICYLNSLKPEDYDNHKDIPFFDIENIPNYEISKNGIVRNKETKHIKKPSINRKGYYQIRLCNSLNIWKTYRVHRLVGLTFIPNPLNLPQLNHLDGNKLNNWDWNLAWTDNSGNQKHAYKLGLQKGNKKRTIEIERDIDILKEQGISGRKIAKILNLNKGIVSYYLKQKKNEIFINNINTTIT